MFYCLPSHCFFFWNPFYIHQGYALCQIIHSICSYSPECVSFPCQRPIRCCAPPLRTLAICEEGVAESSATCPGFAASFLSWLKCLQSTGGVDEVARYTVRVWQEVREREQFLRDFLSRISSLCPLLQPSSAATVIYSSALIFLQNHSRPADVDASGMLLHCLDHAPCTAPYCNLRIDTVVESLIRATQFQSRTANGTGRASCRRSHKTREEMSEICEKLLLMSLTDHNMNSQNILLWSRMATQRLIYSIVV